MKYKLEDICNRIYSGGTPSTIHKEYWNGDLPWLSSGETSQRFVYTTEKFITKEGVQKSSTKYAKRNSTVMASAGQGHTRGQVSFLMNDMYINQSVLVFEPEVSIVNPLYLYYNLDGRYEELRQLSDGTSTRGSLSGRIVKGMEIDLPNLSVQGKIVSVLYDIDKKIENNNQINRNLSEQLKVIFSKMFPTIADSGSNTLEEIISFSNGKKRPDTEGKVPVYGGNGILSYTDKSNAENCVIIGRVGAYCGSLYLSIEPCWISDNAIKAEAKNSKSQMFIYYLLQELALSNRHIGTSQPLLTQGILNAIPFTCPSEEGIISFCKKADDIQKLIDMNTIENKRVSELRDTLLPKLMSGELDVSDLNI